MLTISFKPSVLQMEDRMCLDGSTTGGTILLPPPPPPPPPATPVVVKLPGNGGLNGLNGSATVSA